MYSEQASFKLPPCPDRPNCVCTQSRSGHHRMEPIPYRVTLSEARSRLVDIVGAMPRTTIVRERENYLHIEFRSRLFRLVDDVEFYLEDERGLIQFRSASRRGYSDMGVNRRRMEKICRRFQELDL